MSTIRISKTRSARCADALGPRRGNAQAPSSCLPGKKTLSKENTSWADVRGRAATRSPWAGAAASERCHRRPGVLQPPLSRNQWSATMRPRRRPRECSLLPPPPPPPPPRRRPRRRRRLRRRRLRRRHRRRLRRGRHCRVTRLRPPQPPSAASAATSAANAAAPAAATASASAASPATSTAAAAICPRRLAPPPPPPPFPLPLRSRPRLHSQATGTKRTRRRASHRPYAEHSEEAPRGAHAFRPSVQAALAGSGCRRARPGRAGEGRAARADGECAPLRPLAKTCFMGVFNGMMLPPCLAHTGSRPTQGTTRRPTREASPPRRWGHAGSVVRYTWRAARAPPQPDRGRGGKRGRETGEKRVDNGVGGAQSRSRRSASFTAVRRRPPE